MTDENDRARSGAICFNFCLMRFLLGPLATSIGGGAPPAAASPVTVVE